MKYNCAWMLTILPDAMHCQRCKTQFLRLLSNFFLDLCIYQRQQGGWGISLSELQMKRHTRIISLSQSISYYTRIYFWQCRGRNCEMMGQMLSIKSLKTEFYAFENAFGTMVSIRCNWKNKKSIQFAIRLYSRNTSVTP